MSDETEPTAETPEPETETEEEEYEADPPCILSDGDVTILDPIGLGEQHGCVAWMVRGGSLWGLKDRGRWVNIEDLADKPAAKVSRLK